jgi:fibronectin type 3 domain-containing protein
MRGRKVAIWIVCNLIIGMSLGAMTLVCENARGSVWDVATVDSNGDVGSTSGIAVDSDGHPHISYHDQTNGNLKYAEWTGSSWNIMTVDTVNDAGWDSSIALDSHGYPHISYIDTTLWVLKYARWTGSSWVLQTADATRGSGEYSSIALDGNDLPHISHYNGLQTSMVYTNWTPAHGWRGLALTMVGGEFSSIAVDRNGYPHISYYEQGTWSIRYASWNGTGWKFQVVAGVGPNGCDTSLSLDSADSPHVAYCDITDWVLKYASWNGTAWERETIDPVGNGGRWISLDIDRRDRPHIAYYDGANQDLKYARWNGTAWRIETIDSSGEVGRYLSMAVDGNDYTHISYYDVTNQDLKYVQGIGNDPPFAPSVPSGPSAGHVGITYTYSTVAVDPDIDQVKYTFDWGDGNFSETGYVDSNISASSSHIWGWAGLFNVRANATDMHGASSVWSVSLEVNITGPPGAPANLNASYGDRFVFLSWDAPGYDGRSPITNYRIYRGIAAGLETFLIEVGNVLNYTDSGLTNGGTYYYNVSAKNAVGEGPSSREANATPATYPGPPEALIAVAGNRQVSLTWAPPVDDGGSPAVNYTVYRGTTSGGEVFLAEPGNVTAYVDTGLTNGQRYFYEVSATNKVGEGPNSSEADATPVTLPSEPLNLEASAGTGMVTLTWAPPVDDGGSPIAAYRIYRGTAPGTKTLVNEVGNILDYLDAGLTNGQDYYYQVSARNAVGAGSNSTEAHATPATTPSEPLSLQVSASDRQAVLTWTAPVSDGGSRIIGYRVYRGTVSGGETLLIDIGNILTHTDTGLTNGRRYYYRVSAINAIGEGPSSAEANAIPATTPSEPSNLQGIEGNGQVALSWAPPASDGGSPVTNYKIYRGTTSGGETLIATIGNVTTYTDVNVTNGKTYYYKVSAANAVGDGPKSNETSVTPSAPATPGGDKPIFEEPLFWIAIVAVIIVLVAVAVFISRRKKGKREAGEPPGRKGEDAGK